MIDDVLESEIADEAFLQYWKKRIWQQESGFEKRFNDFNYEVLRDVDQGLHQRLLEQSGFFGEAFRLKDAKQIKIHGESLLRGIMLATERMVMEEKALHFDKASPRYGLGDHPGKPPPKGPRFGWWYKKYLASESWAKKRKLVFERCAYICEGCGIEPAAQVHHGTYDHVGYEFLFELVGICQECHKRYHNK